MARTLLVSELLSLGEAREEIMSLKMPSKVAYKLFRAYEIVNSALEYFNNERIKIVQQYGERDKDGELVLSDATSVKIREDEIEECNQALKELYAIEEEIPDNLLFSIDEIGEREITLSTMAALSPLIKD